MKIGIIGGGQLALMMAQSQPQHKYIFLDPMSKCPASIVGDVIVSSYEDSKNLEKLASLCDVVTFEFENAFSSNLEIIKNKLFPNTKILQYSQNRILEKNLAIELKIPTTEFYEINNIEDIKNILSKNINKQWILKSAMGGYDGKLQVRIESINDIKKAESLIANQKCILEKKVDFLYETSIIINRKSIDEYVYLPPSKNFYSNGILWITHNFDEIDFEKEMIMYTKKIMDKFDMCGTLVAEFFITKDGPIFNEMAPRPHNSGHWSIEGATASQFYNHISAITNQRLIQPRLKGYTAMINLIGSQYLKARQNLNFNNRNIVLHDYFKKEVRPDRKMGHITICYPTIEGVKSRLKIVQEAMENNEKSIRWEEKES